MATGLSFTDDDGKVYATRGDIGADEVVLRFDVTIDKGFVTVVATKPKWIVFTDRLVWKIPLGECSVERIEEGRSAGKAAGGAIAGALVAGPLGLLAGAALGGRKKHVVAVSCGGATLIASLSPSELQGFVARGLIAAG